MDLLYLQGEGRKAFHFSFFAKSTNDIMKGGDSYAKAHYREIAASTS